MCIHQLSRADVPRGPPAVVELLVFGLGEQVVRLEGAGESFGPKGEMNRMKLQRIGMNFVGIEGGCQELHSDNMVANPFSIPKLRSS